MRISAFESSHVQGVILAMRGVDKELAKQTRSATKQSAVPIWSDELARHASTKQETRVLVAPATATVTNQNVTLTTGQAAKRLSGGAHIYELTTATEFGAAPGSTQRVRSSTGKQFKRAMGSRFRPRNKAGYTALPAAANAIPRIASLWVQTAVRTLHEAFEKGAR